MESRARWCCFYGCCNILLVYAKVRPVNGARFWMIGQASNHTVVCDIRGQDVVNQESMKRHTAPALSHDIRQ
ncbi:hypothetical protein F5Y01DRAFT_289394 [Xylaria sp. FL0043]|nr:hypothetical protein F5Y01DRAFT_289394 [Xylaria sp. FL0043]